MKIACVSDIHGNYEALKTVLKDINEQGIDIIFCTGDIIGYYPKPLECIELVKNKCRNVIRGNHDEVVTSDNFNKYLNWFNSSAAKSLIWTRNRLLKPDAASHFFYLRNLPIQEEIILDRKKILLAHGTPEKAWEYFIYPFWAESPPLEYDIRLNRWLKMYDLVVIGHTHQAYIYQSKINSKIVLNPGSVGQPRDYDPKASYGVVEFDKSSINAKIVRIEYDISEICKSILKASLDDYLCQRLFVGR